MMYLKCPACGGIAPLTPGAALEEIVLVETDELEAFIHEHHPHLADDDYFDVIESAGDC